MPDFLLPDLGEGLTEAEIIAWHVQVGDHVDVDQSVVEVETAKAAVEVPVPFAGAVAKIHAAPGAVVAVGQPLITIAADAPEAGFREPGAVTPATAVAGKGSGNVLIGYGTAEPSRKGSRAARRAHRAGGPLPADPPSSPPDRPGPVPVTEVRSRPASRAILRTSGEITATGPGRSGGGGAAGAPAGSGLAARRERRAAREPLRDGSAVP